MAGYEARAQQNNTQHLITSPININLKNPLFYIPNQLGSLWNIPLLKIKKRHHSFSPFSQVKSNLKNQSNLVITEEDSQRINGRRAYKALRGDQSSKHYYQLALGSLR